LKLDIEGAEHKILDLLDKEELFANINKIWIEYHYGQKEILNILTRHFSRITIEIKDQEMGLIRATK
jgi:hypothetical protein